MKTTCLNKLLTLVAVFSLTVAAYAAVPSTINYQGYLKDSTGAPISGATNIRFSLYSSNPSRNNPVWRESKSVIPVNGIYSTQLGSATPFTVPFDVPYYLGVKVEGDAEMALQALSSVPYAQRAKLAENIISSGQLITSVPTGTSPLLITSTTLVPNLNADMVDGKHADDLIATATASLQPAITSIQSQVDGLTSLLPDSTNWDIGLLHQAGMVDSPVVAINNAGHAVAAWRRNPDMGYVNPYVIEARNYTPQTGWESVHHELAALGSCGFQQPIIDSAGNTMIVYMCGGAGTEKLMYSRRPTASTWSVPQQINPVATTTIRNIKTASDPAGNVFVVWQQEAAGCDQSWVIRYMNGSGWGTAQRLDSAECSYTQGNPQVAVDNAGNAIAAWVNYDGNTSSILNSRYIVGSGWSAAGVVTTGVITSTSKLVMDGSGNALVLWTQPDGTWYRRYDTASGWIPAQSFHTGTTAPQVAMSSNGSGMAIWPEHDGSKWNVMARRYLPVSGWDTSERLNISLDNSHVFTPDDIRIAMNSGGNAIAIGTRYNSVSSDIWSMQFKPTSGWGPIQMVEADMTYGGQPMDLAMNDSGSALATWTQRVFTGGSLVSQIMSSRLNTTQSLVLPNTAGSSTTTLIAPSGSESRTIQLPDASGKIITTGNLTDITMVGTIYHGEWQGWRVGIPYGGTDATNAADARANLQVPGLYATNYFTGTQYIGTGANTSRGLVLQGASGQSANLQEWLSDTGLTRASVSSTGVFSGNGSGLTNINLSSVSGALALENGGTGASTPGAARNSLQVPGLFTGNFFTGPQLFSPNFPFENVVVVRGLAGQAANIQEWQNSSGSTLASVSASGRFTGDGSGLTNVAAASVAGMVAISNGGTGSATQNFVDLSSAQTIGGAKTFTTDIRTPILYDQNNTAYYLDPAGTSNVYAVNLAGNANVAAGSYYRYNNQNVISANTDLDNYFFGPAGNLAATGYGNIAIGTSALSQNTTGYSNTATGGSALGTNSSGYLNTATGVSALYTNTSGEENTACGASALALNTTGDSNTATGRFALYSNTDGNNNTASGRDALYNNTTGNYNTALGTLAGVSGTSANANTTGSNNTFIGYNSGPGTSTQLTNATAIGANALVSTNNSLVLGATGGSAVNVGIGTPSPSARLTVVNSAEATKGLTVQGAASQSANLQEWQSSAGTVLASVSPVGVISGNGSGLTNITATNVTGTVAIANGGTGSTTQNFVDLSTVQTIGGTKTFSSTITGSITGNAGTVTNGLYSSGSYANPTWVTALAGSKLTGTVAIANGGTGSSTQNFVDLSTSQTVGGSKTFSSSITASAGARLSDQQIYLRGGSDTLHGVGWYVSNGFVSGSKDGPVVYGCGGGTLGSTCGGNRAALTWDNLGSVNIPGTLSKGGGSFKIDHPLDPRNKFLYHSFVESPDMMNIYNGNVTTGADGFATVEMPTWFEALNRDFRYQLTVIGQFAQAIIAREIEGGRFTIQSDKPAVKVSWQVTGIRKDAYAEKNRIQVEEDKPVAEKGSCLHPEACN